MRPAISFAFAVAPLLLALAACGGRTLDDPSATHNSPRGSDPYGETTPGESPLSADCPPAIPTVGGSCIVVGDCAYVDRCNDMARVSFHCGEDGRWTQPDSPAYAVLCPSTMPREGDSCGVCAASYPSNGCLYADCAGGDSMTGGDALTFGCDVNGSWAITGRTQCHPIDAGAPDGG